MARVRTLLFLTSGQIDQTYIGTYKPRYVGTLECRMLKTPSRIFVQPMYIFFHLNKTKIFQPIRVFGIQEQVPSTRIGSEFLIASEKAVITCDNLNIDMNELSSGQINQDHLARLEADRHNMRRHTCKKKEIYYVTFTPPFASPKRGYSSKN